MYFKRNRYYMNTFIQQNIFIVFFLQIYSKVNIVLLQFCCLQLDFWTLHLIWCNIIYNKTSTEIICNKHCGYLTSLNVLMFTSLCRDELLLFTSGLWDIWRAYVPNNTINCVKGYIELVNYQLSGSVMQNVLMGSRIIHQSKINIRHI